MDQDTRTSRGKGRSRGRGRKKAADQEKNIEETNSVNVENKSNEPEAIALDLDADITQLEAPTFSTINKGPPEPMLRLNWDHKTHLIGEKVINPMIHCCDKCEAPILIYGRMIPCKHVFCLTCAERESNTCPRCQEKVVRIEKTGLGTVFMCTFGGTRYGNTGCRRTYLSQRDLLAHINHRHVSAANNKESLNHNQSTSSSKVVPTVSSRTKPTVTHHVAVAGDPRIQTAGNHEYFYKMHSSSPHTSSSQPSRRQSHHHSTSHLHNENHPATTQSNPHGVPHPQAATQPPTQRHLASPSQQLIPPPDFVNRILVPNFPPPTPNSVAMQGIRNNLITIQSHNSNPDSGHPSVSLAMAQSYPHHQTFPSQFPPTSVGGIPFPVPPPSQSAINALSQTASQFYSNTPINYSLTAQRPPVSQFSPNSPSQSILNQSSMIPNQPSTPQMVPPPRRNQFSRDNVMPQQFPVTQNHRWQQPNQSQFF